MELKHLGRLFTRVPFRSFDSTFLMFELTCFKGAFVTSCDKENLNFKRKNTIVKTINIVGAVY